MPTSFKLFDEPAPKPKPKAKPKPKPAAKPPTDDWPKRVRHFDDGRTVEYANRAEWIASAQERMKKWPS